MNYHESFQVQYPIKFFEATTENHVLRVYSAWKRSPTVRTRFKVINNFDSKDT